MSPVRKHTHRHTDKKPQGYLGPPFPSHAGRVQPPLHPRGPWQCSLSSPFKPASPTWMPPGPKLLCPFSGPCPLTPSHAPDTVLAATISYFYGPLWDEAYSKDSSINFLKPPENLASQLCVFLELSDLMNFSFFSNRRIV